MPQFNLSEDEDGLSPYEAERELQFLDRIEAYVRALDTFITKRSWANTHMDKLHIATDTLLDVIAGCRGDEPMDAVNE